MNPLITELPKGDWAFTVLRQYFMSAYFHLLYTALQRSTDPQLAAIAAKALKEVDYHLKWSKEWVVRLGDGTEESHERMTNALNELWAYTGELFMPADYEQETVIKGIAADCQSFKLIWMDLIHETLQEATLDIPTNLFMHSGGKSGKHTENMGYILAEMQYMQRSYPGCEW
jgi:ring-1,2-phenylacetyl-CoA epoxidase subunit PaaC